MKIERYLIQPFTKEKPQETFEIFVPVGSKFLCVKFMLDGVYGWYLIPEDAEVPLEQKETFGIVQKDMTVQFKEEDFLTVLDTLIDTPQGPAMAVFPIYKLS